MIKARKHINLSDPVYNALLKLKKEFEKDCGELTWSQFIMLLIGKHSK